MASTLASQLQRIKPFVQGEADGRRPFTSPSVIFDPKEAADIDVETILSIAVSGLEVLIKSDTRFGKYKDTLFSRKSREFDRETTGIEENKNIDFSIASYLRLLAGYLQLPSALKTLEYLIRRYKVHMYNVDELVLCALPYHDTHAFVRIVQLLDLGNKKWAFLEGVKASGSPLPRKVIVQQCIRDMGVLEDLCNYALPTKKFQHSRPVFCFCSAVLVEALGAIPTLDSDTVKRIIPFVFSGLSSTQTGGPDHKVLLWKLLCSLLILEFPLLLFSIEYWRCGWFYGASCLRSMHFASFVWIDLMHISFSILSITVRKYESQYVVLPGIWMF